MRYKEPDRNYMYTGWKWTGFILSVNKKSADHILNATDVYVDSKVNYRFFFEHA